MPRRPLLRVADLPYHVTARTNNQLWFQLPLNDVWSVFDEKIAIVSERYSAQVIAFVLMSNHFHLLLQTPLANIAEIMQYLMREVSRSLGTKSGHINHLFGNRYKWCLVDNENYLGHAYKYLYRNPIEVGLAVKVEDYPYSTLRVLVRQLSCKFNLHDHLALNSALVTEDMQRRLEWLNTAYHAKQSDLIKRALRRSQFIISKNNNDRIWARTL